jgi:hypothetical protein
VSQEFPTRRIYDAPLDAAALRGRVVGNRGVAVACLERHPIGSWRPGMAKPEADGRLLDVRTGRHRRIPFRGAVSEPGCLLKDRTGVLVTGLAPEGGALGLYEVDLRTGANRRLGGELLAGGFTLSPALSPDGRTAAVLHQGASQRLLETQVCLVDLGTGDAKPLGNPRDFGPVSWLPDGRGLLTVDRKDVGASKPPLSTISRLDLDGRLTPLREGSSPVVLGDGKTVLFEDAGSRTWQTCDLGGGDVKPYAGGMNGHTFPAPSPDGRRLLMMHFRQSQAPEPMVFRRGENEGKPATTAPGLWAHPARR